MTQPGTPSPGRAPGSLYHKSWNKRRGGKAALWCQDRWKSPLLLQQRRGQLPSVLWKLSGVSGENGLEQGVAGGVGGEGGQAERDKPDHPNKSCRGMDAAEMEPEARTRLGGRKGWTCGD